MKRKKIIVKTSIISIVANLFLVIFKAIVGVLSNSIAIISDSINNLSDALSSIVTIVGAKIAGKEPDREHPYGHGRIEYVASFVVSAIVLYAGFTALIESVKKIIKPEIPTYSTITIIVLVVAIFVKLILGTYVKNKGKQVKSSSLVASGADALNDVIISVSVLSSAIIYIVFNLNIEAYIGVLVSIAIIKTGIELIRESVNSMVGIRIENKLSKSIKKEIMKEESVQGVFDLIINDYGPEKFLGSVHIEVEDTLKASDIDKLSRRITKRILDKYGVILHTIGVYSINTKDKEIIKIREEVHDIVFLHKEILEMHGFYLNKEEKTMSFDIIIDFAAENKEDIYKNIYDEVKKKYKDYHLSIILDIDVSD